MLFHCTVVAYARCVLASSRLWPAHQWRAPSVPLYKKPCPACKRRNRHRKSSVSPSPLHLLIASFNVQEVRKEPISNDADSSGWVISGHDGKPLRAWCPPSISMPTAAWRYSASATHPAGTCGPRRTAQRHRPRRLRCLTCRCRRQSVSSQSHGT